MRHHTHHHLTKQTIDKFMSVIAFLSCLVSLPTLIKIWFTHPTHAAGQSLITWGAWIIFSFAWVCYGFYFKVIGIWFGNIVNIILYTTICIGIVVNVGFTW